MRNLLPVGLVLLVGVLMGGCRSIYDRSAKYQGVIGHHFALKETAILVRPPFGASDIVALRLATPEDAGDSVVVKKVLCVLPAGTVLLVKDAKVSYKGGDWDFLLVEVERPDTHERVVFEQMLGFSSVDPKTVEERWTRLD